MTDALKALAGLVERFFVQLVAALILGPLLAWLTVAILPGRIYSPSVASAISGLIGFFGFSVAIGVYLVNRDNQRLKNCAGELHAINHIYRDALSGLLFVGQEGGSGPANVDMLLLERGVLNQICEKVANIFGNLTGRKCVVTVKLIVVEQTEKFCFTWARSQTDIHRQEAPGAKYSLLNGKNTGLDEALKFRPSGPSFFFSADLWRDAMEGKYHNEREGWQRLYRSTIVVPIRRVLDRAEGKSDLIGFLCVDTTSAKRLNDRYEVEYLAAFADQMYNFLSIVRGKYCLPPNPKAPAGKSHPQSTQEAALEPKRGPSV